MENFAAETIADRDNENNAVLQALPICLPGQIDRGILTTFDAKALDADAPTCFIVHPFDKINNLTKDEALARLLELEEDQERTFFEMGSVLSMIRKRKWFDPCASLDEWVEKNTAISRAKARALIQIHDTIVKSGVKWADVQHIPWTKLRAIACVLNHETAEHWIEIASNHSKAEVINLAREHSLHSAKRKSGAETALQVTTLRLRGSQTQSIQAAIEKAKKLNNTEHDSAALEVICQDYMEKTVSIEPEVFVDKFVDYLNTLDKKAAGEILKTVRERVQHAP